MLPMNLFFLRHGESEKNLASNYGESPLKIRLMQTPDWQVRLSLRGIEQAKTTGRWIKENIGVSYFHTGLVSPFVRTRETAAYLGLNLSWKINLAIHERDFGLQEKLSEVGRAEDKVRRKTDPIFHRMGEGTGQSLADILVSSTFWFLDTLHREHSQENVLAVCHGERMWALRYIMERMTPERAAFLMQSDKVSDKIHNCQILHYTRINPHNPSDVRLTCDWVRSFCPCFEDETGMIDTGWKTIHRETHNDEDLLSQVDCYPRHLTN